MVYFAVRVRNEIAEQVRQLLHELNEGNYISENVDENCEEQKHMVDVSRYPTKSPENEKSIDGLDIIHCKMSNDRIPRTIYTVVSKDNLVFDHVGKLEEFILEKVYKDKDADGWIRTYNRAYLKRMIDYCNDNHYRCEIRYDGNAWFFKKEDESKSKFFYMKFEGGEVEKGIIDYGEET